MNNLIKSLTGKYIVNVLMLVVFTGLAITGIFFMEGGEDRNRTVGNGQDKTVAGSERTVRSERHRHVSNEMRGDFAGVRSEREGGGEELHQTLGIIWLILMFLHTWQHWNWYLKLFTLKQIMKDKLLSLTTITFFLMVLSSIMLGIEVIPDSFLNIKEFHGTIGQVLTGLMVIHIIQRFKWYITVTLKLIPGKPVQVTNG